MTNQFAFLILTVCTTLLSSLTLCNTSLFTRPVKLTFSILFQRHISKLPLLHLFQCHISKLLKYLFPKNVRIFVPDVMNIIDSKAYLGFQYWYGLP